MANHDNSAVRPNTVSQGLPELLPRLWRFGLVLSGRRDAAEDLVQATCLRALERAEQFRPGTRLDHWTFAILSSIWKNQLRAEKIRAGAGFVDAALRARLGNLRMGDRPFRESFDHLMESSPRDRLQEILIAAEAAQTQTITKPANDGTPSSWWRPAALAASLLLAVGIGYLGGQLPSNRDVPAATAELGAQDAWRLAVAEYQVLYTRETLAGLSGSRELQQAGLRRVGGTLGLALPADVVMVPELDYKRAQILRFGDQPLAQLAYLHGDQTPVAFCITGTDQPDQTPQAEQLKGLNVVHWVKDGFAFMVIGDLPHDLLDRIGQRLAESVG